MPTISANPDEQLTLQLKVIGAMYLRGNKMLTNICFRYHSMLCARNRGILGHREFHQTVQELLQSVSAEARDDLELAFRQVEQLPQRG